MPRRAIWALLAVACGGPVDSTLVDELRVVAAIPDAAELGAGESFVVTSTIVHPDNAPVDVMVWMCTPTGGPGSECAEAGQADASAWVAVVRGAALTSTAELQIHPDWAPLLGQERIAVPMWILACEPGLCPIIDQVEAAKQGGDLSPIAGTLADPTGMLQGLPLVGVAATRRSLYLSNRDAADRNLHPVVTEGPIEAVAGDAELGASFLLGLDDAGPLTAYAYATRGGFSEAATDADDDGVQLTWLAPPEGDGDAQLFVVVKDSEGGEALWTGQAVIER